MGIDAGSSLGSYEVVAPLGAGGMGEVYRARDTKLGRDVAIKVLPEAFAHDPDRLARFEREAQLLASLNHPNIAGIYGLEEAGGVRALVLELVEGETLADRICPQGPMPGRRGAGHRAADRRGARGGAREGHHPSRSEAGQHQADADGTVKVLDFGLAKALDAGSSGVGSAGCVDPLADAHVRRRRRRA